MKGIQIGKEVLKLSLFADDLILNIENPKFSTKKRLELTNNSIKLQDTRLIHRNLMLFCTLIMNYQKENSRKQSHLQLHRIE